MSSTHTQPSGKRQKVREARVSENVDYFQGIDKIDYNNMASPTDSNSYRYYNSSERLHSRAMEDWLKCSVSLTEFRNNGAYHGKPNRPWDDNTTTLENHKRSIKALFDLCAKLGIKHWTALDSDLVPATDSWDENKANWDEIVEYIQELSQRSHVKLLWVAPDLHSNYRYASGALTSTDATTFVQAAAQIKKCLEISQRLNAESFLIYPHREGYETIFQTDVPREIKLFSKLLKISAEYKDRLNFRCQLMIMPYCNKYNDHYYNVNFREDLVNRYMWDVTSCLYFLKSYNLDRYYKVCTPPGHHMFMANVYSMLGGVTVSNAVDQCDSKILALMMKCIVDQGTTPPGGINLKLSVRRDGDLREMVTMYVKYIDALAKALRTACSIVAEQIFSKHVQQRYVSYYGGFGARLASSDVTLEECEEYHKKNPTHSEACSKSEHLEVVFQRYLDACDHV